MKKVYLLCALAASLSVAHAQNKNPLYYASGFNVFTKSGLTLTAGDTHGPVATGGDLTLNGATVIGMNSTGTYPNGLNDAGNYGMVIGGRINYTSGNVSYVNNGYLRLGNTTGTTLYEKDNNNAATNLQATSGAFNAQTRVQLQRLQTVASATSAHGLDFTNAFNQLSNNSSIINNLGTNSPCSNFNYIAAPTTQNPHIALSGTQINYMKLTLAELTNLNNLGSLIFDNHPDAAHILIINVTGTGAYTWTTPNIGGVNESDGAYILINFPQLTSLTLGGSNSVYGSVLAPGADVYKTGANNNNGQIVSKSLTIAYGEIHYFPFAGTINLCNNTIYNTPPYQMNSYNTPQTPLPLSAVTLKAATINKVQMLSWTAQADNLSDSYTAERSTDGKSFTAIGMVAALQANGAQSYQLADNGEVNGNVLYRIRILATDGKTGYSNTVQIRTESSHASAAVSPVPFHNVLNVSLDHAAAGTTFLATITDLTGRVVLRQAMNNASNAVEGVAMLTPGIYLLRVADSNNTTVLNQKIVKE